MNPWGLTPREAEVVEAMIDLGTQKLAARRLDISPKTVEANLGRVRGRMGNVHLIKVLVEWDRWARKGSQ